MATKKTEAAQAVKNTARQETPVEGAEAKPETVTVKLFKDNRRYKGDVFASVNGRRYQIQRGVEVEVPPEVAEVLEHSQHQDDLTAARIAEAEATAEK
jgi:hypothetical protein